MDQHNSDSTTQLPAAFSESSTAALTARALSIDYAETMGVVPVTTKADLPEQFSDWDLCPVPGMLFPWRHPETGDIVWQYRPDNPPDAERKYLFAPGQYQPLGLVRDAKTTARTSVIVEGTMQSLVVARYAPDDVAVYGIAGCWGWSHDGVPTSLLRVTRNTNTVVFLDADAGSNLSVYNAGVRLAEALSHYNPPEPPRFARIPVSGNAGVDDYLAGQHEDDRATIVASLVEQARPKPADAKPKPAKRNGATGEATSGLTDPNDTSLAYQWVLRNTDTFRWLTDDEYWYSYERGRWSKTGGSVVGSSVGEYLEEVAQEHLAAAESETDPERAEELEKTGRMLWSNDKLRSVRSRASALSLLHLRRDQLDQYPKLWCASNGVIDLATGQFHDHDPELLLTTGSDVAYDPDAQCPTFDAFLAEALPDADVRDFVMRVFALAMLGEVREHVLPVFIGEGSNGKGTLIRLMHAVFGSHSVIVKPQSLLVREFEAHEQEVARMAGKRLATVEETGQGSRWDVARINSWTGGDSLTGRFMRAESFDFRPSHTLVMATNHRPNVGQGERAFWRRYREVPFGVSFEGREDLTIEPHIVENELPGLLNRLLQAGQQYRTNGLSEPMAVVMATAEAKVDTDHMARFAAEKVTVTGDIDDRIPNPELFDTVKRWWPHNVTGDVMPGERTFIKTMRSALGFDPSADNPRKARTSSGNAVRTWFGVRWSEGDSDRFEPLPDHDQVAELPITDRQLDHDRSDGPTNQSDSVEESQHQNRDQVVDNHDHVATGLPIAVDHENTIVAGDSPTVDDVVDVADKSTLIELLSEKDIKNHDQEGVYVCSSTPTRGSRKLSATLATRQQATDLTAPVVFDLETDDGDRLHSCPDPCSFVRIAGRRVDGHTEVETGYKIVLDHVRKSRTVIGHNILAFDLQALSRIDESVDVLSMTRQHRVLDTMVTESVLHPIRNDGRPGAVGRAAKHFALDSTAKRYGLNGKTDDLERLIKKWGDYDKIPNDDEEYRAYCAGDVDATMAVARAQIAELRTLSQWRRNYLQREHRVHAIASEMSRQGFGVDRKLLQQRFWHGYGRKNDLTRELVAKYGIPTTKADGKPAESPAATRGGREAVLHALELLGVKVDAMEKTPKGSVAFGVEPMTRLAEAYADHPNVAEIGALAEMVGAVGGIRTVYGTALENLHDDGRVHPKVVTFQASGRWSVRKPGLTVFGKRNGRVTERAIFVPGEGNVLIAIDLSQVDARAIAVHAQDHGYLDLFEPGMDSHTEVAKLVWGDVSRRHDAKAIAHGWNYGMGLSKIVSTAKVTPKVAQQFDATMRQQFPRLVAWRDEIESKAAAGEALDNGFGRVLIPDPDRAHTQGPALMGQGTARDLMAQCLLRLDDMAPEVVRMLRAQVHDEAVFEVPCDQESEVRRVLTEAFNFPWAPPGVDREVKILAECGPSGSDWSRCY